MQCRIGSLVTLLAAVQLIYPPREIVSRYNTNVRMSSVLLGDPSLSFFRLTFWSTHADEVEHLHTGDIIVVTYARIREWKGEITASSTSRSTVTNLSQMRHTPDVALASCEQLQRLDDWIRQCYGYLRDGPMHRGNTCGAENDNYQDSYVACRTGAPQSTKDVTTSSMSTAYIPLRALRLGMRVSVTAVLMSAPLPPSATSTGPTPRLALLYAMLCDGTEREDMLELAISSSPAGDAMKFALEKAINEVIEVRDAIVESCILTGRTILRAQPTTSITVLEAGHPLSFRLLRLRPTPLDSVAALRGFTGVAVVHARVVEVLFELSDGGRYCIKQGDSAALSGIDLTRLIFIGCRRCGQPLLPTSDPNIPLPCLSCGCMAKATHYYSPCTILLANVEDENEKPVTRDASTATPAQAACVRAKPVRVFVGSKLVSTLLAGLAVEDLAQAHGETAVVTIFRDHCLALLNNAPVAFTIDCCSSLDTHGYVKEFSAILRDMSPPLVHP